MAETNSPLNLIYQLVNSDDGSKLVFLTKDKQVPIPNDLTLSITNPTPIEFINTGGFTPSTPLPGLGAPNPGLQLDRLYIWFLWGGHDAVVGIPSVNDHGQVTDIPVVQGGFGYSDVSPPTLQINGGSGRGLEASVMVKSDGSVSGIEIINPGSGYQVTDLGSGSTKPSPPTVSIPQLALGNALCTFDQAKGITVVAADAMTGNTWYVSNPNFDHATIGVYWTLFPKTRAKLGPTEEVKFDLKGIFSTALPGFPLLYVGVSFANKVIPVTSSGAQVITKYHKPYVKSFTVDSPSTPLPALSKVQLKWTAWGADYVVVTPNNDDLSARLPHQCPPPLEGRTYTLAPDDPRSTSMQLRLQAFTNDGMASPVVTNNIFFAPKIVSFVAGSERRNPGWIHIPWGDPWVLDWNVTQASHASIDQGIGEISLPVGQLRFTPPPSRSISGELSSGNRYAFSLPDDVAYREDSRMYTLTAMANGVSTTWAALRVISYLTVTIKVGNSNDIDADDPPHPAGFINGASPQGPGYLKWAIEGVTQASLEGSGSIPLRGWRTLDAAPGIYAGTNSYTFLVGDAEAGLRIYLKVPILVQGPEPIE